MTQDRYGSADVLALEEIAMPVAGDDEVLIRVRAAGVGPDVWHLMTGLPYLVRATGIGLRRPKARVPGYDVAGTVEAVGKDVSGFRPGDEVFGTCNGAFAEYACARTQTLAPKPANLSFEQAAAVPVSGTTALRGVRDAGGAQAGQAVLIVGASGGVGTFAVQLAKMFGAHVTGVCSSTKMELVRSLGADHVIDYRNEDYLRNGERYDFILDVVSVRSPREYRHALSPTGTYTPIGHSHYDNTRRRILGDMPYFVWLLLRTLADPQKRKDFNMLKKPEAMAIFRELLESGTLTPIVGKTFSLDEVPAALQWMREGRTPGRAIITP